jgi:predicted aldo/keto reductase-like oxidoreductase
MAMVEENISIASEVEIDTLADEDFQLYEQVKQAINEKTKVPCTACSYCMPCPFGVDIPGCFRCYNVSYTDGYFKGLMEYILSTTLRNKQSIASLCTECGACEKHCPQSISIIADLKKVKRRFETPLFKIVNFFIKRRYK